MLCVIVISTELGWVQSFRVCSELMNVADDLSVFLFVFTVCHWHMALSEKKIYRRFICYTYACKLCTPTPLSFSICYTYACKLCSPPLSLVSVSLRISPAVSMGTAFSCQKNDTAEMAPSFITVYAAFNYRNSLFSDSAAKEPMIEPLGPVVYGRPRLLNGRRCFGWPAFSFLSAQSLGWNRWKRLGFPPHPPRPPKTHTQQQQQQQTNPPRYVKTCHRSRTYLGSSSVLVLVWGNQRSKLK